MQLCKNSLTVRKIFFNFSAVSQAEKSYFVFNKKLKSTQNEQKHSYIEELQRPEYLHDRKRQIDFLSVV